MTKSMKNKIGKIKVKTRKSILKRLKITSSGKLLKRHQLGAGHLKRNKSKSALNRQIKTSTVNAQETRTLKKALGM